MQMPRFLAALAITLLAGVWTTSSSAADLKKVIIAQSNDGFLYGPIYVAVAKKYFEAEGLEPEIIVMGGGAKAMSAVLAGSAQIYAGAPFELVNAVERGQKVKSFAQVMDKVMISLILRKDTAERIGIAANSPVDARIKALKGLKLGISSSKSSGEGLYRNLLRRGGLDPDRDTDIVPIGSGGSALAAFVAGKVDMYTFSSPFGEQALVRGPGIVLFDMSAGDIPEYAHYPYITLIGRDDWLASDPQAVGGTIRALAKAMQLLHSDRNGARAILREVFPKLEQDVFDASFEANMQSYPASPAIDPKVFNTALAEYALIAGHQVTLPLDQLATNQYVDAALKR